jgi:predicted PurR-regulated permease PerM
VLAVVAVVAAIAGSYFASAVVLPALAALFLAMLVAPMAGWFARRGLRRGGGAFLAVTLALALIGLGGFGCFRAFSGVVREAPRYAETLKQAVSRVEAKLARFKLKTSRLAPEAGETPANPVRFVQNEDHQWESVALRGLGSLMEAAGLAIFVPFLALFLLMESGLLQRALDQAAGSGYDGARLRARAPEMVRAYVIGNVLLAGALALVQTGMFLAFGLPNAAGLGLVTGFFNVIPLIGLPLALMLPLLQGLGTFTGPLPFAVVGGALLALHLIASNWVIPRWIGVHVKLNATASTLGMLFFSWLWGLTGFLMAVPLTALIKIALECSPRGAPLAALLAAPEEHEEPRASEHSHRGHAGPIARFRRWRTGRAVKVR